MKIYDIWLRMDLMTPIIRKGMSQFYISSSNDMIFYVVVDANIVKEACENLKIDFNVRGVILISRKMS